MFDLHNHMLPGLDDGAPDWEQSLNMARIATEDGIEGVVCTPHWVFGSFDNTRSLVMNTVDNLRHRLAEAEIPLEVYPGSELRLDFNLPQKIESRELLTLNDSGRYALIELPDDILPQNMSNFFWELQSQDITPIIAHPERNRRLLRHPTRLFKWVNMGVLTQLTASSILGRFGKEIRSFSILLLKHNMIHVLATDSHGPKARVPKLKEGLEAVEKIVGAEKAHKMVFDTPRRVIRGEDVIPQDPIPFKSRTNTGSPIRKFFSFLGLSSR